MCLLRAIHSDWNGDKSRVMNDPDELRCTTVTTLYLSNQLPEKDFNYIGEN
jgi:hypothetical protein